jgi:hypothetical protein
MPDQIIQSHYIEFFLQPGDQLPEEIRPDVSEAIQRQKITIIY